MAVVLLITSKASLFLPLTHLPHQVVTITPRDQVLSASAACDIVLVDARTDVVSAKKLCQMFKTAGVVVPRVAILAEDGLTAYSRDWGCEDFLMDSITATELATRLRILTASGHDADTRIAIGPLVIDEAAYSVWLDHAPLDLTYTEFELLKYLATHPGRVFSRDQLLTEVWGYDYYGGTRTVDVHVRRLRAKLGSEHESLIGTVRNVGYRFTAK